MEDTDYGKPIKIFYANLLHCGVELSAEDGRLYVDGNTEALSPVYRDEIVKRKAHLIEMLTPAPPSELEPYFGRLLKLNELTQALGVAEQMQARVDATPANGGWLLTMPKVA